MQDTDIGSATDPTQSTDKGTSEQVDDKMKSPTKKKIKKSKTTKEDKAAKRNRSGSSLKKELICIRDQGSRSNTLRKGLQF